MASVIAFIIELICSAIPALGFALLFNVPRRLLRYCAILGGGGHVLRTLLLNIGVEHVTATFLTSAAIGFAGIAIGKSIHAHPKVITIASIIPMLPGVPAYQAMMLLLEMSEHGYSDVLFGQMWNAFIQTIFLLGALVVGLTFPGMLFFRRRPVV